MEVLGLNSVGQAITTAGNEIDQELELDQLLEEKEVSQASSVSTELNREGNGDHEGMERFKDFLRSRKSQNLKTKSTPSHLSHFDIQSLSPGLKKYFQIQENDRTLLMRGLYLDKYA